MECRFCNKKLEYLFISLGRMPLANSYLTAKELHKTEPFYPLEVYVCDNCFLVQLQEFESPENIFGDYAYFSSYSDAWLKHVEAYVDKMIELLGLNLKSYVIEIASNDGYLLQYFMKRKIPVLGIEPARNVAEIAKQKKIPTEVKFFGTETARTLASSGKHADLLLGNNVLAHVPNINDFVTGLKIALKSEGVITMEFSHLMRLMEEAQFDTIYHEHFSYFSFFTVEKIFSAHGLAIFDVEELSTHGGSLRIYAKHIEDNTRPMSGRVVELRKREYGAGYADIRHYRGLSKKAEAIKKDIVNFFMNAKKEKKNIVGYGAAAKGNTLLNYCNIKTGFIDYVADKNPHKQGCFLPGSRIPIESPDKIKQTKPDYIFVLAWNIKDEIMEQLSFVKEWGAKFVIPIPKIKVV